MKQCSFQCHQNIEHYQNSKHHKEFINNDLPLTFYTLISHLLIHTFYSVKDLGSQVSVVLSHKTFMNWHLHHNTINLLPQSSFIIIRTYMRAWWYTTPLASQLIRQQVGLWWNGISLLSLIF